MGRLRVTAGRGGSVLAVVGALVLAPLLASVPAQAAEVPANAIVVVGSDTTNAWVVDDGNREFESSSGPTFVTFSTVPKVGAIRSTALFTTPVLDGSLPTSGEHPVSAAGPLRLELTDRNTMGCTVEGTVTVIELTRDANGAVSSMALDWAGDCGGAPSGQVRLASTAPYGGLDVERDPTWFEPYIGEANQPYDVVVTGHGTQPLPAITSVAVVPPVSGRPSHVELYGTDTCSGTTLADQETCSVTVDAAPWDQTRETVTDPLRFQTSTGSSTSTLTNRLGPLPSRRGLFADAMSRRMDTRTGLGVRKGVVGAGKSVTLKLTGGAVPEVGTASAVLNLTVTGSTSAGYVTAYPAGTPRPTASSINFPKGWTGANLVTVPLGADGSVTFFNSAGTVHLVADLVGVYASGRTWSRDGSDYHPQVPTRVLDSRTASGKPLGPNAVATLPVDYGSAVNARVRGVVLNVTVTGPTGTGYVSAVGVQPTGPPATSTLNYTRGLTAANMAVVPVTGTGTGARQVYLANVGSASTHVVVDVVGYFADVVSTEPGLRYRALSPTRVVDTRSDLGLASVGAGVAKRVQAPIAVAGRDTAALVANLTGVLPSADTHLTVWDAGVLPAVSNLNLMKGVTRANSIWPGLDATNGFRVQNAVGSVGALVDVTGSFERFPPSLETLAGVPYPAAG